MIRKYPNLCKQIQIGRVTFRNRMFSAPMGGTDITNDGCIGPKSTAFYELRGKGGAGAVTVSECLVHPKTDGSHAYHLDTSILNSLASATYTADAIRRHGAIPSIELSHSGMYAGTYMTDKSRQKSMNQWGPSDTVRPDGVEIRTSTPVTKEYAEKENADALIIAAGSRPLVPPIPGLNGDNVVIVNNYYKEKEKVGDEVVVFGGGLAGCECAIHLGMEGKKVRIVEMRDVLAPDANVRHRPLLLKEIDKYAEVYTGYKGLEVTEEGVWCEDKEGKKVLVPGSTIICALGQRSRTDIVDELRDCAPYVAVIGDASRVSTITNAVYWGYHAALDI